jgi:predicted transcriptional regulator
MTDCEVRYRELVAERRCIYCYVLELEAEAESLKTKLEEADEWNKKVEAWNKERGGMVAHLETENESLKAKLDYAEERNEKVEAWNRERGEMVVCLKAEVERLKKELHQERMRLTLCAKCDAEVMEEVEKMRKDPSYRPDKED